MLQIDYDYLGRLAEGLYCRLDRLAEATERCCRASEAALIRRPARGLNVVERQFLLGAGPITTVADPNASRQWLFFGVDGSVQARISTHPTLCLGGFTLQGESGPLILRRDLDYPLPLLGWYATGVAGVVLTVIEVY